MQPQALGTVEKVIFGAQKLSFAVLKLVRELEFPNEQKGFSTSLSVCVRSGLFGRGQAIEQDRILTD
jgi:hypothetical protein